MELSDRRRFPQAHEMELGLAGLAVAVHASPPHVGEPAFCFPFGTGAVVLAQHCAQQVEPKKQPRLQVQRPWQSHVIPANILHLLILQAVGEGVGAVVGAGVLHHTSGAGSHAPLALHLSTAPAVRP